jgi:DNA-binding NtrC family response regulator
MKTIIITDKSPHIRMLISREFEDLNCKIERDLSQEQLVEIIRADIPAAIILDPESLTINPLFFIKKINELSPETIVIIHAYDDWRDIFCESRTLFFIEKNAESIETVKKFVQSNVLL